MLLPTTSCGDEGETDTLATEIWTVTDAEPLIPPAPAVMVALPSAMPVTSPFELTRFGRSADSRSHP
jgi:hypothetical protein